MEFLLELCELPNQSDEVMKLSIETLSWVSSRPEYAMSVFAFSTSLWRASVSQEKTCRPESVFREKLTYNPSEKLAAKKDRSSVHEMLIDFIKDRYNILHLSRREASALAADVIRQTRKSLLAR